MQHTHTVCRFSNSNSWVVLSPVEQRIKEKIEAIGTPLKDWDIQINYGIKTGLNEAFIISTEKRDEILAACLSEEERQKTAEIIRPNNLCYLEFQTIYYLFFCGYLYLLIALSVLSQMKENTV